MSIKKFLKKQRERRSGGGGRIKFYRKSKGDHVLRLFTQKDEEGDEIPAFQFYTHRISRRESVVCPKTFDMDAECQLCDEASFAFDAGDKETGRNKMKKEGNWFLVASVEGKEHEVTILELPYGATNKLWVSLALASGLWTSTEVDWSNEEFIEAAEKGFNLCCGEKAKDVILTYTPNAMANTYKFRISSRPGKKLNITNYESPICLTPVFRAVRKLDGDRPTSTEPSAPPVDPNEMTKAELIEIADFQGVEYKRGWSKAKIAAAIMGS